jgi:hypothetical protein
LPVKEFDFDQNFAKQSQVTLPQTHQFGFIAQDVQKHISPTLLQKFILQRLISQAMKLK